MDCNKCPVGTIEEEIKKVCFSVTSGKLENHRGYLALVRRAYKADAAMKLLNKVLKMDAKYILEKGQCTKNDCKECALVATIKEFSDLFAPLDVPTNLDEAIEALGKLLPAGANKRILKGRTEENFITTYHHGLGRWIRNNWGLWDETSQLHQWFEAYGIFHADDMSGIIFTSYYRKVKDINIDLHMQVAKYIEYWAKKENQK